MVTKMRAYRPLPTTILSPDETRDEDDLVAIESALEVRVGKEFIAGFVCTPGLEKELALGYMLSTGIVNAAADVKQIRYASNRCTITVTDQARTDTQRGFSQVRRFIGTECSAPEILRTLRTAEGIPVMTHKVTVTFSRIYDASRLMFEAQVGRKRTGALHGAAIYAISDDDHVFAEDLGRHNAVDKAIGLAIERGLDLRSCFAICTGRLTADVVSKCAWTSVPLLVSFAVATDAGIKFAQKANLTLVGAFKGKRMRLYNTGAAEIVTDTEV
jgi:FdhD protein